MQGPPVLSYDEITEIVDANMLEAWNATNVIQPMFSFKDDAYKDEPGPDGARWPEPTAWKLYFDYLDFCFGYDEFIAEAPGTVYNRNVS